MLIRVLEYSSKSKYISMRYLLLNKYCVSEIDIIGNKYPMFMWYYEEDETHTYKRYLHRL